MKTKLKFIFPVLLWSLFQACEKQYPWDFSPVEDHRIIADGIITNELAAQCINLSWTNPELNDTIHPVSGARVVVDDSLNIFEFIEAVEKPGIYYSEPFQVVVGREYRLTVEYGSETFQALSEVVPVTALDSMIVILDESRNLYRFIYSGGNQPSMTEVFYDWSHDTAYCRTYGNCYAQETYYTLDNIDVNAVFSPPRERIYFPVGTIMIRRKYGLTEEHQQFIRSLLMETDWSGGIFDIQHGNVLTNMSNGALGYFAACMVITDTTVID